MYGVVRYEDEDCYVVEELGEETEPYLQRLRYHVSKFAKGREYEIYIRHLGKTEFEFDSITKRKFIKGKLSNA